MKNLRKFSCKYLDQWKPLDSISNDVVPVISRLNERNYMNENQTWRSMNWLPVMDLIGRWFNLDISDEHSWTDGKYFPIFRKKTESTFKILTHREKSNVQTAKLWLYYLLMMVKNISHSIVLKFCTQVVQFAFQIS